MELDPKKQAYWAEHSRRWKASGLSQRDYCNGEDLSYSTFDRWRRLIREATAAKATQAASQTAAPAKLTLVQAQVGVEAGMASEIAHSPVYMGSYSEPSPQISLVNFPKSR